MKETLLKFSWMSFKDPSSNFTIRSDGTTMEFSGKDVRHQPLSMGFDLMPGALELALESITNALYENHAIGYEDGDGMAQSSCWFLKVHDGGLTYHMQGSLGKEETELVTGQTSI